ncbi:MAG: fluoride efflux transporter CrcB [Lewinellaceae bacterium]|nr:fluoride efflux transporter CrcB [Saprospiraceae bacterium]MCB9338213.1 fluoride efflux transporter CrcB [Lewinellaceae bacterium]
MHNYILVFIGGGLGSICRFGIGHLLAGYRFQYPWATFAANVVSCFILGILFALSTKGRISGQMAVMLMAGFCGGFSTFSTFTNETFQLLLAGEFFKAASNVALSLGVCLVSLYAGLKMAA